MTESRWVYTDKPLPIPPVRQVPQWATFIKGRSPHEFKTHATLGHAKNSLTAVQHGILYRYLEEWTPVVIWNSEGRSEGLEFLMPRQVPTEQVFVHTIREEP